MGADLYIQPYADEAREKHEEAFLKACERRDSLKPGTPAAQKAQEAVYAAYDAMHPDEWYFRDSYNKSNLLWRMGLSWWQDVPDYLDEEDEDSMPIMAGADLIAFRSMLMKAKAENWKPAEDPEEEEYFQDKYDRFLAFLNRAINLQAPIECSY